MSQTGLKLFDSASSNLRKYQFSTVWINNETRLNESNMNEMQQLIRIAGDELFNQSSKDTLYHRLNRLQYETAGNTYTNPGSITTEFDQNVGLLARDEQVVTTLFNAHVSHVAADGEEAPKVYRYRYYGVIMPADKYGPPISYSIYPSPVYSTAYNADNQFVDPSERTIAGWAGLINGRYDEKDYDLNEEIGLLGNIVRSVNDVIGEVNKHRCTYRPGAIVAVDPQGDGTDTELLVWKQNDDTTYNFGYGDALLNPAVKIRYSDTESADYLSADGPEIDYNSIVTYGEENDYSFAPGADVKRYTLLAVKKKFDTFSNLLAKEDFVCADGLKYEVSGSAYVLVGTDNDKVISGKSIVPPTYRYNSNAEETNNVDTGIEYVYFDPPQNKVWVNVEKNSKGTTTIGEGKQTLTVWTKLDLSKVVAPYNKLMVTDEDSKITAEKVSDLYSSLTGVTAGIQGNIVTLRRNLTVTGCYRYYLRSSSSSISIPSSVSDLSTSLYYHGSGDHGSRMSHKAAIGDRYIVAVIPYAANAVPVFTLRDTGNSGQEDYATHSSAKYSTVTLEDGHSYLVLRIELDAPFTAETYLYIDND